MKILQRICLAVSLILPLSAFAIAAPAPVLHGGWKVNDVFIYTRGCHSEEAILKAVAFFAQESNLPFTDLECFTLTYFMPIRLVRSVGDYPMGDTLAYVWEIVDLMREREFVILPLRSDVVPSSIDSI